MCNTERFFEIKSNFDTSPRKTSEIDFIPGRNTDYISENPSMRRTVKESLKGAFKHQLQREDADEILVHFSGIR